MEREKIKLTAEELQWAVYGDSEDFEVVSSEITDTWRHGNECEAILKRISDEKYFKVDYRDSVKDECEFEHMNSDGEYSEVFPTTKTITVYE